MKELKFSKTYIAAFLYRFAFLLFVPFLQGFLFARYGAATLITLYGADLAVVVLLCTVATVRCSGGRLYVSKGGVRLCRGALIKSDDFVSPLSFGSLTLTQGLFLRLFGAQRLRFFAGTAYSTVYLKTTDSTDVLSVFTPSQPKRTVHSGIFRTLLMSAAFSNSLTGLLAAAPLIRRAASVLGARQTALLIEGVDLEGWLAFTGLPPVLSRLSSLLFLCWIVGFATEFFREYGLRLSLSPDSMTVQKGLITKTTAVFKPESVTALLFRQSLLLFLWGLYSTQVCINIKPFRRLHVLSAATRTRCADLEDDVLGQKGNVHFTASPPTKALFGYTWLPLMFICLSAAAVILVSELLPHSVFRGIPSVAVGMGVLWFFFRVLALYRSSVTVWEKCVEVKWFSGMNFTRFVFKKENIISAEITQSIFQRHRGLCNIKFTLALRKSVQVRIKHISLSCAERILKII